MPPRLRAELAADPFYKICVVTGSTIGKIEWHHNATWQGRQLQERFAILPIMDYIHEKARLSHVKDILDWIMLNRAIDEELREYSKAEDLRAKRDRLNFRFHRVWKEGDYTFHNL